MELLNGRSMSSASTKQEPADLAGQTDALPGSQRTIIALVGLFMYVHDELPAPYMDEQFHVDQLHAYCAGNFSYVSTFFCSPIFIGFHSGGWPPRETLLRSNGFRSADRVFLANFG